VLDGESHRKKALHRREFELLAARYEESQRELKSLIATTDASIQESRALIAEIGKILAKRL
jgi:hypothetical protein